MRVNFNTPVCKVEVSQSKKAFPKFSFVEDFFTWSGRYYVVDESKSLKDKHVVSLSVHSYRQTVLRKVLKVFSYLTIIMPIIMLFAKLISRKGKAYEISSLPNTPKSKSIGGKFDPVTKMLNQNSLGLKPQDIPYPNPKADTNVADLQVFAIALGIQYPHMQGINDLVRILTSPYQDNNVKMAACFVKAIIDRFNDTNIQEDLRKEVLTNIGRDCGSTVCAPGRVMKLQKEYGRLLGVDTDSVQEIVLREIADLKVDLLNEVAHFRELNIIPSVHPHFISAAQVAWGFELGLDEAAGRRDTSYAGYLNYTNQYTKQLFLSLYKPQTIVEHVLGKLNANVDQNGSALHIAEYNEFIKTYLVVDGFEKPSSLDALMAHPRLGKYANKVIDLMPAAYKDNLDQIYDETLNDYIKDKFISYTEPDELDMTSPQFLKQAGLEYILEKMEILNP